ncbi:MAG: hypothetical protein JW838_03730 [Spirochaetes bacterium]|nr:hypothetical protein [Spirochaetota bacterium]
MNIWLITALICISIVITILFLIKKRKKKLLAELIRRREGGQRQDRAYFANALILNSQAGIVGEQAARVRTTLKLQISVTDGNPYTVNTVWLVDLAAIDYLKPGNDISVKIDPDDPKIIYPGAPWAKYAGV